MREESSYRTFYGRLLQPFVHYVPFWVNRPQELLDAVAWAEANDQEAQRIAKHGQQLAMRWAAAAAGAGWRCRSGARGLRRMKRAALQ
jgi:hypothetical protein